MDNSGEMDLFWREAQLDPREEQPLSGALRAAVIEGELVT